MEPGGSTTKIGFVGLGAMGGRIAGRLLASGYQVYGTTIAALFSVLGELAGQESAQTRT